MLVTQSTIALLSCCARYRSISTPQLASSSAILRAWLNSMSPPTVDWGSSGSSALSPNSWKHSGGNLHCDDAFFLW